MRKRGTALRAAQQDDAKAGRGSSPGFGSTDAATSPVPLDFTPVPRRYRFDGWTPERQRAFIEALADTGCVDRAARMVNMAQANCYTLRRAPGAEAFRRAWDAALDFGLKRLKDIAFERAIEGELVPVFVGGKLIGFRRKYNDRLLMFCLRHYGEDANGRRVTVNFFSTRATAGAVAGAGADGPSTGSGRAGAGPSTGSGRAGAGVATAACAAAPPPLDAVERSPSPSRGGLAGAEAFVTTVRTVIRGRGVSTGPDTNGEGLDAKGDKAAAVLNGFEGVELDAEAAAAIQAALEECAARARARDRDYEAGGVAAEEAAEEDPARLFFRSSDPYRGTLIPPPCDEWVPFAPGEAHWTDAGAAMPEELVRVLDAMEQDGEQPAGDAGGRKRGRGGKGGA